MKALQKVSKFLSDYTSVSYTHLDVDKRQVVDW